MSFRTMFEKIGARWPLWLGLSLVGFVASAIMMTAGAAGLAGRTMEWIGTMARLYRGWSWWRTALSRLQQHPAAASGPDPRDGPVQTPRGPVGPTDRSDHKL